MNAIILPHFDWVRLKQRVCIGAAVAFAFALGGWVVSIRDQGASLPYYRRSAAALQIIREQIGPNPLAQVNCERRKIAVLDKTAKQAIASNYSDAIPTPALPHLPPCPK